MLKEFAVKMESSCVLDNLYLFESPADIKDKYLLIVATEHCILSGGGPNPTLGYEFFRARAEMPAGHGVPLHPWGNSISVAVCHQTKTVLFGPVSQIQMYPVGQRLGSALMAKVINWLHGKGLGSYDVVPGTVTRATVHTDEERVHRNAFYMNFGFALAGSDVNHEPATGLDVLDGHFSASNVDHLGVPVKYEKLLKKSSEFYSALETERYVAGLKEADLKGAYKWANGHSVLAPLKRILLWIMDSPLDKR